MKKQVFALFVACGLLLVPLMASSVETQWFGFSAPPTIIEQEPEQLEMLLHMELACLHSSDILWVVETRTSLGWVATPLHDPELSVDDKPSVTCSEIGKQFGLDLLVGREEMEVSGNWVIVDIVLRDSSGYDKSFSDRVFLRKEGSSLSVSNYQEYKLEDLLGPEGELSLVFSGETNLGPKEYSSLPPWQNPMIAPDKREELALEFGAIPIESTEQSQSALVSFETTGPIPDSGGCSSSGRTSSDTAAWPTLFLMLLGSLFIVRKTGMRRSTLPLIILFLLPSSIATATTGYVYGYVSYWDTRTPKSSELGCRVCNCDTADTTCMPWETDCCFEGIPRVEIMLKEWDNQLGWQMVDYGYTDQTGFYIVEDSDWESGRFYMIDIYYYRPGYPFKTMLTQETGYTVYHQPTPYFQSTSQYNARPNTSVNLAGDAVSGSGDLATIWKTTHDAAEALEEEGDSRLQHLKDGSGYDQITMRYYYIGGPSNSDCAGSTIHIDVSAARTAVPAHELGHQYHGRVVGCSGGAATFPPVRWDPHHYKTAEGNALTESVAQITALLTYWDPDVAETADIYSDYTECATSTDGYPSSNRASADKNNYLTLWEMLDTSTSHPTPTLYYDHVDVTMEDLMDSMLAWQQFHAPSCTSDGNCQTGEKCIDSRCHGRNSTAEEQWMEPSGSTCPAYDSDQCPGGQVCSPGGLCYSGDPHGGNIYDWMAHVSSTLSIQLGDLKWAMWQTDCLGGEDDSHPFTKGYHSD